METNYEHYFGDPHKASRMRVEVIKPTYDKEARYLVYAHRGTGGLCDLDRPCIKICDSREDYEKWLNDEYRPCE